MWGAGATSLQRTIALGIFAASYVGLGLGRAPGLRIDRTGVAIIGAALMVLTGVLPWNDAVRAVDAHTLVLLFGMMIVAAYVRLSGFFGLVAMWAVRGAKSPRALLAMIVAASGILSALFVNDVVCLVLAPLVISVTRRLALPAVPYLVALAAAANVGSLATLTGNPQNMLVGSFSDLTYLGFLVREGPIALLGLAIVFGVVWLVYRRELPGAFGAAAADDRVLVHHRPLLLTGAVVGAMLIAFLAGVPITLVAVGGAAVSLFVGRVKPARVYREVNWPLLVLFVGLFVLTGGIERAGVAADLVEWARAVGLHSPAILVVAATVLSNLVSNVPAVLLLKPVITSFGDPDRAWLMVAMASTLAGNLTILGSVANLIVVEAARKARVEIGFLEYCRTGVPITLLTLMLGWLMLMAAPASVGTAPTNHFLAHISVADNRVTDAVVTTENGARRGTPRREKGE